MAYWLDNTPSTGSGAGMYVTNSGIPSSGSAPLSAPSAGGGNMAMFGAVAGAKAGFARTDAIVKANNELSYYYSIVQNAMNNQTITHLDKLNVRNAGIEAQKKVRRASIHRKGSIRTGYAGRNIRLNAGGSPVDIIHSTNVIEAEERRLIHVNTENAENALELKRLNFKRQEEAARNKASTISPTARGNQAFLGSLLSSAGTFAMA